MNARQTKKNLKRKIQKLEFDNNLMKRIIEDHSEMLRVYDLYNSPLFVTQTTMHIQKYCAEKIIPWFSPDIYNEYIIEMSKRQLVEKMLYVVRENTIFDVEKDDIGVRVRATLYLGRKDDLVDDDDRRAGDSIFQRYEKKDVRGSFKNMP